MEPTRYRIAVRGRLTEHLGSAFGGLTLEPGGEQSVLAGEIRDQADLYGVLDRVRDLGLELVSVEKDSATVQADKEPRGSANGNGVTSVRSGKDRDFPNAAVVSVPPPAPAASR